MFGSTILEAVIALTFIYLLLGLACTVIYEVIAGMLALRARDLERGIHALLKDPALVDKFYDHPIISSLRVGKQPPSYIPSHSFALALLDIVEASDTYGESNSRDIRKTLHSLPDDGPTGDLKHTLLVIANEAAGNNNRVRDGIEIWYNSAMERVSSLYKQRALRSLLIISLLLTITANVDTIGVANSIWLRPVFLDSLAASARAGRHATDPEGSQTAAPDYPLTIPAPTPQPSPEVRPGRDGWAEVELTRRTIELLRLPLGWSDPPLLAGLTPSDLLTLLLGWLITALVVSLCATFWFDTLNKSIVFRSTIKPRDRAIELLLRERSYHDVKEEDNYKSS